MDEFEQDDSQRPGIAFLGVKRFLVGFWGHVGR